MKPALFLLILALALAACDLSPTPVPPTPTPGLYDPANSGTGWERSPAAIVFRSDVTGGEQDEFLARNDVPSCTVYGDNRVVWTNEVGPLDVQGLYDVVPDASVRYFADYLIISEQFYTYDARADLQIPSAVSPVVEVMQLNVNGQPHSTDAFAGWDYEYYQRILDACRTISQTPVLFEPAGAWISARRVDYNLEIPIITWEPSAAGLSIADVANSGERHWLADNNVRILWNVLRTSAPGIQFIENDETFQIALEVPNVTRDAPPAPDGA